MVVSESQKRAMENYKKSHPEVIKANNCACQKRWYDKNKAKKKEYMKQYYQKKKQIQFL